VQGPMRTTLKTSCSPTKSSSNANSPSAPRARPPSTAPWASTIATASISPSIPTTPKAAGSPPTSRKR
jgi:hypothetical protein